MMRITNLYEAKKSYNYVLRKKTKKNRKQNVITADLRLMADKTRV